VRRRRASVLGGLAACVAAVLLAAGCTPLPGGQEVPGLPTTSAGPTQGAIDAPAAQPPTDLGSDDRLNRLAQECFRGQIKACDDLVRLSEPGSRYETYGATCGQRNSTVTSCAQRYARASGAKQGSPSGVIARVGLAGHEGYDRFVLEFDGPGLPAYQIAYSSRESVEVAGDDVPLTGTALLAITVSPGRTKDRLPVRLKTDTSNIQEAALVNVGPGSLKWMLAVDRPTAFKIFVLEDPSRLVIDVSNR
jgi:hypothetical protein